MKEKKQKRKQLIHHDGEKFTNQLIDSSGFNLIADLNTKKFVIKRGKIDNIDSIILKGFSI